MTEDLRALDDWLSPLIAHLGPAARRSLARELARDLRRSQQQRIAAQLNPDGSAYESRKVTLRELKGHVRRGAMFSKIRAAKHLKVDATADEASVGFAGRVARIASVHQLGLRDRVRPDGPEVQYAARRLLGLTPMEREAIRDKVLQSLAGKT
jgi:phage virion morphogenesis protein